MMGQVGGREPFDDGREDLEVLADLRVTTKAIERVAEAVGEQIEQENQREQEQILGGKVIPFLAKPGYPSCTWRSMRAGCRSWRERPKDAKARRNRQAQDAGGQARVCIHPDGGGREGIRGTG